MRSIFGWGRRLGAVLSDNRNGPWGPGGGEGGGSGGDGGGGPRNPWGRPPRRRKSGSTTGQVTSLDEFLKKSRARFGGGLPRDGRPYWLYGLVGFVLLWVLFTSVHRVGPHYCGDFRPTQCRLHRRPDGRSH